MVIPAAYINVSIYYAYHNIKTLLTKYNKNLLFCKRFIDDMFSIWTPSDNPNAWKNFKEKPVLGILEWEVEERTTSANFIDLSISINKDSKIETRLYQKEMNIYLYLPPTSAHPLSVIHGMICGMLRKYDEQNSHRKHNIKMSVLLL